MIGHPKSSRKHTTIINQAMIGMDKNMANRTQMNLQTKFKFPQLWTNIVAWATTLGQMELSKHPHHHSTQPLETSKLAGQPRGATAAQHRGDSAGAAILQPACLKGALQMVVRRPQSKNQNKEQSKDNHK